jgi:hypothetical protein
MEASNHSARYERRQKKRSAEQKIQGKVISATRVIDFKPGARFPVKVQSPHTDSRGGLHTLYYSAMLVVDDDGRTYLTDIKGYDVPRFAETDYYATVEVPGYSEWQMISNFPVEISWHTQGVVYTKLAIDSLKTWGREARL